MIKKNLFRFDLKKRCFEKDSCKIVKILTKKAKNNNNLKISL